MILVREVSGPAKALAGGQATYQATKFNVPNPPAAEIQQISWIVKRDEETVARFNQIGATLVFDVPANLLGERIRVMPFRHSPSATVSVMSRVVADLNMNGAEVVFLSRSDWGARTDLPRLGATVNRGSRTEVFIHHTVIIDEDETTNEWEDLNEVKQRMRQLQTTRPDLGRDVPYNFVAFCMADGELVLCEGRGLDRSGAHTVGHNHSALAVSFQGNFENLPLPANLDAQLTALGNWLRERRELDGFVNLGTDRPLGREVFGHRDIKATDCPGQHVFDRLSLIEFL